MEELVSCMDLIYLIALNIAIIMNPISMICNLLRQGHLFGYKQYKYKPYGLLNFLFSIEWVNIDNCILTPQCCYIG